MERRYYSSRTTVGKFPGLSVPFCSGFYFNYPNKRPYPYKPPPPPPPTFDSFVVFQGSRVVNPKVGPLSSHSSDALWTPRHQVRTHLSVAWFAAFLPRVLQAMTERCGNLATRRRVGPLCSTIQPSPLSGWPRRGTDKPTMQVDSAPSLPTSHPGWALAWVVEHFLRVTAHPKILALAQDNTVIPIAW